MRSAQVASKALGILFATAVLAVAQSVPDQPDALDLLKKVALDLPSHEDLLREVSNRSVNERPSYANNDDNGRDHYGRFFKEGAYGEHGHGGYAHHF